MNTKITEIEALRGIAVIMVVIHHASDNLFTWTSPELTRFYTYFSGWFGVDLFFAISGFVIARDLIPRLTADNNPTARAREVLAFWTRRAWRLLPSAWLWLAIILFCSMFINSTGVFGTFRTNFEATVAGLLNVANIRFAEVFMNRHYGGSFVYWSLSLEEQFYLILPFVILASRKYLPYLLGAIVIAQLISTRSPMLMAFRTDAIALGVLLAIWSSHTSYRIFKPQILHKYGAGKFLLVLLLVCMSALGSSSLNIVQVKVGLIAISSAILVWAASYNDNLLCLDNITKKLLAWLGARSYAIYLTHIPAFFLIREAYSTLYPEISLAPLKTLIFIITATLIITILSELNYKLIEQPLRKRGRTIAEAIKSE